MGCVEDKKFPEIGVAEQSLEKIDYREGAILPKNWVEVMLNSPEALYSVDFFRFYGISLRAIFTAITKCIIEPTVKLYSQ